MVNLYTTGCPKCRVLEAKLKQKGVDYNIKSSEEDINKLIEEGYKSIPILEIDDKKYIFEEAVKIVNAM